MAKSQAVITLLATAVALAEKVDNAELKDCIEALEFLGEDAKGNTQEYKDLKEVVEKIEAELADKTDGNDDVDNTDTNNDDTGADDEDTQDDEADDAKVDTQKAVKKKRLNYAGVKQIGGMWYCKKDNYKKGFSTANECAEHFNH